MPKLVASLSRDLGVNQAISYSVTGKLWLMLAGVVNIWVIGAFTSVSEQGYIYTFQSLLAFQVLFDLGLATVLVQFAAHEMSGLKWKDGTVVGSPESKSRLSSIVRLTIKWYSIAALIMSVILALGGTIFLSMIDNDNLGVSWETPWLLLCAIASLLLFNAPFFGILEGCGKIQEVAFLRFVQEALSSLVFWVSLIVDCGLYSLPLYFSSRLFFQIGYLYFSKRAFFVDLVSFTDKSKQVGFVAEVWPFQSRFLLSSLSSLVAYSALVPMVFAAQGPAAAGQLGMTLAITGAILTVSFVWISTKVPFFCDAIARGDYEALDTSFRHSVKQAAVVITILSVAVLALILILLTLKNTLISRITEPVIFLIFLLAVLVGFPNVALSAYLRAHKKEVLAVPNIVSAISAASLNLVAVQSSGLLYVSLVQLGANLFLSVWVYKKYQVHRQLWHYDKAV
jgi:O-antigen/teichoic acid export membrane protein